jgi:hypothetical protein
MSTNAGANAIIGASSNRSFERCDGSMFSFVSIFSASAMRNGMPPSVRPKTRIRFGPTRFWIIADHLRSPTVSAEAVIIWTTSMMKTTHARAAPYSGGQPSRANPAAAPPTPM